MPARSVQSSAPLRMRHMEIVHVGLVEARWFRHRKTGLEEPVDADAIDAKDKGWISVRFSGNAKDGMLCMISELATMKNNCGV